MNTKKYFLIALEITIITCPISISISQLFLGISFLLFLLDSQRRKRVEFPNIAKSAFLLFFWLFVSAIFHYSDYSNFKEFSNTLFKSEFKDILLFLGFFLTFSLEKDEWLRIQKSFFISILILVISGFVSIFSLYRFSYYFKLWMGKPVGLPTQHHMGTIFGVHFYLPIGFMNTHLTYGGILMFFYPFLFYKFVENWRLNRLSKTTIYSLFFLLIATVTFLLNNGRSALIGAAISILFGFIDYSYQNRFQWKILLRNSLFFISSIILVLLIAISIPSLERTIMPLVGKQKHTDHGRFFIWYTTFSLFEKNPILGVGPGRFTVELEISKNNILKENSKLIYFFENIQRGHAHNDYFHHLAVGGFPSLVFYLGILFFLIKQFQDSLLNTIDRSLFYGLISIFFAGLLQCYFQDDEVVIVFWLLLGFFFSKSTEKLYIES